MKEKKPADELAETVIKAGNMIEKLSAVLIFVALSAAATVVAWYSVKWIVGNQQKWATGVTAVLLSAAWFAWRDRRK
jgi:hypothetical protein